VPLLLFDAYNITWLQPKDKYFIFNVTLVTKQKP